MACGISHVHCTKPGRDTFRQKHQYFRQNGTTGEMSCPKKGELFLILIPRPSVKLQKYFREKVKEPHWHQRRSSSTGEVREGACLGGAGVLLLPLWAL